MSVLHAWSTRAARRHGTHWAAGIVYGRGIYRPDRPNWCFRSHRTRRTHRRSRLNRPNGCSWCDWSYRSIWSNGRNGRNGRRRDWRGRPHRTNRY